MHEWHCLVQPYHVTLWDKCIIDYQRLKPSRQDVIDASRAFQCHMHLRPQRHLACPARQVLYKAIGINGLLRCKRFSGTQAACNEDSIIEQDDQHETRPPDRRFGAHVSPKASAKLLYSTKAEYPAHRVYRQETSAGKLVQEEHRPKSWRDRLIKFSHYEYESDFENSFTKGRRRMVDEDIHAENWEIWLELLKFQQRHHGDEGVRRVWREIVKKDLDLPVEGPCAEDLWYRILQTATKDELYMNEILPYASRLQQRTGKTVPRVYITVVASKLKTNAPECLQWHIRLKEHFLPQLSEYLQLFQLAATSSKLPTFKAIFTDYPVCPMYANVVPKLCELRMYDLAYQWHFTLLDSGDRPTEFTSIEPLLTHYAQLEDDRRVEKLVRSVIASGSRIEEPLNRFVRGSKTISREIMNRQLGEVHGIIPKRLSDSFCARLFATKLFRVETVINGLGMMAAESIGPFSLREIVLRDDYDTRAICRHFDLLREAGITLGTSKYETLIRQAALGNRRSLLRSVIECDAHPDTFEDMNLQEKMFAMYLERDNKVQMKRVLATIACEVPETALEMQKQNLLLRGYIRLNDKARALSSLERMRVMKVPLTPKTSRHMRVWWLPRRQVAKTGFISLNKQHLSLVIHVMKQTLECGSTIPIDAWKEILRRLGMYGQLDECRSLALWLVPWYSSPPPVVGSGKILQRSFDRIAVSRKSESKMSSLADRNLFPRSSLDSLQVSPERELGTSLYAPISTTRAAPHTHGNQNHLNQLFTIAGQQAIIAWGFLQDAKQQPRPVKDQQPRLDSRPTWTWGLLLLRELRERGVPMNKETISRACRIRLAQLFGTRPRSRRSVNRAARRRNESQIALGDPRAMYGAYVQQMEAIWGADLFTGHARTRSKGCEVHGAASRRTNWRIVEDRSDASNI